MSRLDPFYEVRGEMLERLERDLVGPGDVEETIRDFPLEKYICGILYPRSEDRIDPAQDHDVAEGEDEATYGDPPVALANEKYPSSAGMTFAVQLARAKEITVTASAAMYIHEESEAGKQWKRRALAIEPLPLRVDQPTSDRRIALADGLELFARIRPADDGGAAAVTLALVNTRTAKPGQRDADAFFQPALLVEAADARLHSSSETSAGRCRSTMRISAPTACSTVMHGRLPRATVARSTGPPRPARNTPVVSR